MNSCHAFLAPQLAGLPLFRPTTSSSSSPPPHPPCYHHLPCVHCRSRLFLRSSTSVNRPLRLRPDQNPYSASIPHRLLPPSDPPRRPPPPAPPHPSLPLPPPRHHSLLASDMIRDVAWPWSPPSDARPTPDILLDTAETAVPGRPPPVPPLHQPFSPLSLQTPAPTRPISHHTDRRAPGPPDSSCHMHIRVPHCTLTPPNQPF